MNDALQSHLRAGDYDHIADGSGFASRLTADLRAVSHDRHLRVRFTPFKIPNGLGAPTPEEIARTHDEMLRRDCAFDKVEVLPGDIGYIKFDAFMPSDVCAPTVIAAMGFVAHADALIFDLRDNGGGDPAMIAFIASYLFDHPVHLNDLNNRHEHSTMRIFTRRWKPEREDMCSRTQWIWS